MNNSLFFLLLITFFLSCSSNNYNKFPDISLSKERIDKKSSTVNILGNSEANNDDAKSKTPHDVIAIYSDNGSLILCLPVILERILFYERNSLIVIPKNTLGLYISSLSKSFRQNYLWKLFSLVDSNDNYLEVLHSFHVKKKNISNIYFSGDDGNFYSIDGLVKLQASDVNVLTRVDISNSQIKLSKFDNQVKIFTVSTPYSLKTIPSICESINFQ